MGPRLEGPYPVADLFSVVAEDDEDVLDPLGKGLQMVLAQGGGGHAYGVALLLEHRQGHDGADRGGQELKDLLS